MNTQNFPSFFTLENYRAYLNLRTKRDQTNFIFRILAVTSVLNASAVFDIIGWGEKRRKLMSIGSL